MNCQNFKKRHLQNGDWGGKWRVSCSAMLLRGKDTPVMPCVRWPDEPIHGTSTKHLQMYLSEYCYRFNRRSFGGAIFDRLLIAIAR